MTAMNTRQNIHPTEVVNLLDIFDKNGRVDSVQSGAVEREIFSEANTVRRPDGTIDHTASAVKHAAAKVTAVLNRK
jgi:hypothetical protein